MKVFNHSPLATALPEITAEMVDGKRFYTTPEGKKYPSITSVLSILSKDGIDEWRAKVGASKADQICEHAANRGTDLHAVLESYLKNEPLVFPEDKQSRVKLMFSRMKRTLADVDNIIAQEIPLYSDALGLAGRCDCIANYKDILSVIDFKSTTKAKKKDWIKSYFLQATGYSLMLEERTGIKAEQIVILMSGEEDFSCQVFVENREPHIEKLKETIALFAQAA